MRTNDELITLITDLIVENLDEIIEELDNEKPNWVNTDHMEEDGYDDLYDYYNDHNNGEAGDAVYESFIKPLLINNGITEKEFDIIETSDIYEILNDELGTIDFI